MPLKNGETNWLMKRSITNYFTQKERAGFIFPECHDGSFDAFSLQLMNRAGSGKASLFI